jgi:hypothetical protein
LIKKENLFLFEDHQGVKSFSCTSWQVEKKEREKKIGSFCKGGKKSLEQKGILS